MTNLELVEYNPEVEFQEGSMSLKTLAMSTSYSALYNYCIETYGVKPGAGQVDWNKFYEIVPSKIIIIPEKN